MYIARKSEEEQAAFFDAVAQKALQAEAATSRISHVIAIAGTHVQLIFAGDRLEKEIMPALSHLLCDAPKADVSFHVWDSRSTGVTMAAPPCERDHFTDRGDIWGFSSDRYRTAFHWSEFSVSVFDRQENTGIWWVESADNLPYWTKASPLRSLFHWWMEMNGKQLVHGAAIGTADGAVLVTGKGGVGKSTTALSGIVAGLNYVGDDYLIVGLEPEPAVYSLYGTAKLNPDQMQKFPALAPFVTNSALLAEEKAVLRLYPHFAPQIASCMKLRAVLAPRFGSGRETDFAPASSALLHRATSFTTMSQLPYSGRFTHDFVHRMIEQVPGFEMVLGRDLKGVIGAIGGLLGKTDAQLRALARDGRPSTPDGSLPRVSVVLPVFNGASFLREAVNGILAQEYLALEIIVIDDGSTDNIDQVVSELPVEVRYFKQENAGAAAARNRGIKDASGELIAFLDVDDLWPQNNLKSLVDTLSADPGIGLAHGHGQLMEYDDQTGHYEYVGNPQESFPFYIGAGLYRRAVFERVGLFDSTLKFAEDTDWYNRAHEAGIAILRVPEVTLLVRRHDRNMTNGKSLAELNTLRVVKKKLDRRRGEAAQQASPPTARRA